MRFIEIKFLFEGVIFSSQVFIEGISDSLNRYEFIISFSTKYLICKYRDAYFFVLENDRFKHTYGRDEKEDELIKTLQEAIMNVYHNIRKDFHMQKEYCYDEVL